MMDMQKFNELNDKNNVNHINVLESFIKYVPDHLLNNVYVRNMKSVYGKIRLYFKSYPEMSYYLDIPLHQIRSGISPINKFYELITKYNIRDYDDAVISCIGNSRYIPSNLKITPSLMYLLGVFIGAGVYNINIDKGQYNLLISNIEQFDNLCSKINELGSFYTENTTINGGKQVYYGGKIWYLLFRYVFNIPEQFDNREIPDIVYNTTSLLRQSFIEGLSSTGIII